MPQVKTVLQAFSLIRAGEVNDHSGAAAKGAAAAGIKIIGSGRVADIQVKVCMSVNKAGEEQLSADIYNLCVRITDMRCNLFNDFAVYKHVRKLSAVRVNYSTALKDFFHGETAPLYGKY